MFDLRYHAASLAAVFLALIVGILVGVAVSRSGFVSSAERKVLNQRIADLERRLEATRSGQAQTTREQKATDSYVKSTYPTLVAGKLAGKHIALVFVGPVDGQLRANVQTALVDAGAPPPLRLRSIRVPIDMRSLESSIPRRGALARYRGRDKIGDLGRELGQELVDGGKTALWDALADQLVQERSGSGHNMADGVVVVRTVKPQLGATARFLDGLFGGLASAGKPAVGVESSGSEGTAVGVYHRKGLSSVDSVDTLSGKLALVFLLAGAQPGSYGIKDSADDGVLPPLYSLPPATTTGG